MSSKQLAMKGLWLRGSIWWMAATIPGFGRVRISLGTTDLAEAIRKSRAVRAEPVKELGGPERRGNAVDSYFEHLTRRGVSKNYCLVNHAALSKALREMDVREATQVTAPRLRKWFEDHLDAGRQRNTVQVLTRLRRLFRWLVAERRMVMDPSEGITLPKLAPRLRRRFLTREQADGLLEACSDQRLKFALYCALHAGMRKGEIVAARPDWFDLQAGLLHIQNTPDFLIKDREDRTVPLTDAFRVFLGSYGLQSPYMLPGGKAERRDAPKRGKGTQRPKRSKSPRERYRYDFRRPFMDLMKAQGLEGFTFHDLRRTFASLLVSSGVSVYKVAKWLGDGVAVVEKRYGHLVAADEDINRAWERR